MQPKNWVAIKKWEKMRSAMQKNNWGAIQKKLKTFEATSRQPRKLIFGIQPYFNPAG
jgi:hypothetical protein